jgi:hypothetical protein
MLEFGDMNTNSKRKLNVPKGCKTEEFTRFDDLLRKVVSVPKEEINRREKEEKQKKETKKR